MNLETASKTHGRKVRCCRCFGFARLMLYARLNILKLALSMILACLNAGVADDAASRTATPFATSTQTLIEVEVKFIEIRESDFVDNGIPWIFDSSDTTNNAAEVSETIPDGQTRSLSSKNGVRTRITAGDADGNKGLVYHYDKESNTICPAGVRRQQKITLDRELTDKQVQLVMQALEQQSGINLLSAPKVTTRSGENAEIKVVREIIYPAKYQMQTFAWNKKTGEIRVVSTNDIVQPPAVLVSAMGITEFATRNAGVILNVTPTLKSDGKTILLDINAEVCELADWIDYGAIMQYVDGEFKHAKITQPVFHSRRLVSNISLQDGATVVMGRLTSKNTETQTDKVPIIGNIPFLGRLFRHETTKYVDTIFLVCITARTHKPAAQWGGEAVSP